jgi:phage shock protein C
MVDGACTKDSAPLTLNDNGWRYSMTEATSQQPPTAGPAPTQPSHSRKDHGGLVGGLVLIVLGLIFLADNLIPGFSFSDYWPLILVAIGIGLLWKGRRTE